MRVSRAAIVSVIFGVGGCTMGPDFTPPKPPDIAHWHDPSARTPPATKPVSAIGASSTHASTGRAKAPNAAAARAAPPPPVTEASNPDPQWWNRFNDPTLTALIDKSISGNLDLQQAVMRVVEAHQNEVTARAAGLPNVNGNGSYNREQLGLHGLLLSKGLPGQITSLSAPNSVLNSYSPGLGNEAASAINGTLSSLYAPVNLFQYGLSSSWELDLFGRVRRSVEQAKASTQAQVEATNDSLVMLEGQVADAYVGLRGAQALLASQQQNVNTAREALNLTEKRQRNGLTTQLDVEQARTQLDNTQYQLPAYEKQAQQAMDRLNVLTGQPPGVLDSMLVRPAPLPTVPAVVGIGVPTELARRRPDIREAEAQLHAATANVGVAVASFYPDVSLSGSFGLRALDASYLTNWASAFYSFGPSVSLPIFQGGRLTAGLRLARAQEAQAALAYRGTVLNALREVEDALVAYRNDRVARDRLTETVRAAGVTLYLARNSYANGLSDFIQVLNAEQTLTSARQQLVQANVELTNDVVALYNALGGGWQDETGGIQAPVVNPRTPPVPAALDSVAAR